jgi:hypothetical protein
LKFLDKVFQKYSNIKFCENRFSGSRAFPCGRVDGQMCRHDEDDTIQQILDDNVVVKCIYYRYVFWAAEYENNSKILWLALILEIMVLLQLYVQEI